MIIKLNFQNDTYVINGLFLILGFIKDGLNVLANVESLVIGKLLILGICVEFFVKIIKFNNPKYFKTLKLTLAWVNGTYLSWYTDIYVLKYW